MDNLAPETTERTKWTRERVFRLGFLVGRGCKPAEIADDPGVDSTIATVRTMTSNMGGAFSDVPAGVMLDLPRGVIATLQDQARRRQQTTEAFAGLVMKILSKDPVLLANVIDDGA